MDENDIVILNFNFKLLRDEVLKKPEAKYLIMNEETYNYLLIYHHLILVDSKRYSSFYGVPIAICNNKETGVVEIV